MPATSAPPSRPKAPIGAYGFLIAGQARARGLVLVTRNLREFERVPGLKVENWQDEPVA